MSPKRKNRSPDRRKKISSDATTHLSVTWLAEQHAWWQPLALVVVVALTYSPVLDLAWIWDDDQYVYANPMHRNWRGLWAIWSDPSSSPQYYPITLTAIWAQFQLFGSEPAGYHVFNLLIHAANGLLCLAILRQLRLKAAFWIACAFCLHPIQVETVAWVTEIKNLLSGLFYGLSWLVLWPALQSPNLQNPDASNCSQGSPDSENAAGVSSTELQQLSVNQRQVALRYLVSMFLFLMALFSKSITASLPAAMAVACWYRQGKLSVRQLVFLGPMLLLGAWAGWRTASLEREHVGATGNEWDYGFVERIGIASKSMLHYLQQCILPQEQIFFYPRFETQFSTSAIAATLTCVLIGLALLVWTWRSGKRGAISAAAFFVGSALPALGFLNVYPHRFSFVADHFVYLPVIGVFCFLWSLLLRLAQQVVRHYGVSAQFAVIGLWSILGVYAWHSRQHIPAFASELSLWQDTLNKNPHSVAAMQNLALAYARNDRPSLALEWLQEAEKYSFDRYQTLNSQGMVLGMLGRTEEAKQAFEKSLEEYPDNPRPWINLGNLLRRETKDANSKSLLTEVARTPEDCYRQAWQIRDNYLAAFALGTLAYEARDYAAAATWFSRAVKQRPWDLDAQFNQAQSLFEAGQIEAAEQACQSILDDFPNDRATHALLQRCHDSHHKKELGGDT